MRETPPGERISYPPNDARWSFPKQWLLFCAAMLCCALLSVAQDKDEQGFEIISHRARLQLFPQSLALQGVDTLSLRIADPRPDKLSLRMIRMLSADDVFMKGKQREFTQKSDRLEIDDVPSDSVVDVVVSYTGNFAFRSEFSGFTTERAVLREDEVLPTGPKAYRFSRLSLVVPSDWTTIAVGGKVSESATADTTTTVWEFNQSLPNLGWICAGKFVTYEDHTSAVPISVHLFQDDSLSAAKVLALTKEVLPFYSKMFSPYRFPKLDIVEVEDWFAGRNALAIAAPSYIMVKKQAFTTDDPFNQVEAILAHEIAHQWWPATVYVEDQDAALLSEGMCEYSALMFNESKGMIGRRDSLGNHPLLRSLISKVINGRDAPLQKKADLRAQPTQYLKSSYVHNMLRRLLGDSLFAALYHEYARRFALQRVGMQQFQDLAGELYGKKLDWFFDQWVKNRGMPRLRLYNVKTVQSGTAWKTRGRVRMLGYKKYSTFIDAGVRTSKQLSTARLFIGVDSAGVYHNDAGFEITTDEKPSQAILDPKGDVLKIQKLPVKLGDLRDPSDGVMIIGTLKHAEYLLGRARKDAAAMENSGWSMEVKFDTSVTLSDLQQERVFLYGNADENSVAADLAAKFPMHVQGSSILANGEKLSDSTLALIQMIESPYTSNGTFCWIVPFSQHAQPELLPLDASWALVRGKDEITSGTWVVTDEDLTVDIK